MSDIGDIYTAMNEEGQKRRAANRESSPARLKASGISYISKNGGAHLIIEHSGLVIDFWPGTGKWIVRGKKVERRGVYNLIRYLGCDDPGGVR